MLAESDLPGMPVTGWILIRLEISAGWIRLECWSLILVCPGALMLVRDARNSGGLRGGVSWSGHVLPGEVARVEMKLNDAVRSILVEEKSRLEKSV